MVPSLEVCWEIALSFKSRSVVLKENESWDNLRVCTSFSWRINFVLPIFQAASVQYAYALFAIT